MSEYNVFDKIAGVLKSAFSSSAKPPEPDFEQLQRAQHIRNLLNEGIRKTPAEIAEEKAQMDKRSLQLSCDRDADPVSGKATRPECKAFEMRKPF
jgi:hypothetical protein